MDFDDTPEEAAFRAEARAFLNANAARKQRSRGAHRYGDTDAAELARTKAWQAKKADAGFAGITWPKEWGGRGGSAMQQIIWDQEEADYDVPQNVFLIGLGMCIPTMMAYAKPEQLQRYVRPALRGEEIWCQLFSEPAGGSDVAGLRTRAEKRSDEWLINGQKIWTSGAHYSDYGLLLTRSDPNVPKHAGLTAFFIDMHAPGVEVRPIHQMSGASNFNEVFFTDLRVPDAQRLGAPGAGWKVAITTLMNERLAVGEIRRPDLADLIELARAVEVDGRPAITDPSVRERIAEWHARSQGLTYTRLRILTAVVARADSWSRELDCQGGERREAAGDRFVRHGLARHGRRRDGSSAGADAGDVPGRPAVLTKPPHSRWHRRNPTQHHRRTCAGPARRRARG